MSENPMPSADGSPALLIRNATLKLEGNTILHDFNWRVERGERWFVLGPNGAGKTTLVKMILGMAWPLYGSEVRVLGNRYGACDIAQVRKKVAWVSPFLSAWTEGSDHRWTALDVALSGLDSTIGFYRKPKDEEVAMALAALDRIGARHLADRYYDRLSSGEQMKALIARALIGHPELMLLDEPCVYLDLSSREYLLSAIDELAAGPDAPTMIFITQRIEEITASFTKGMILGSGRVQCIGGRARILNAENLSAAFGMKIRLHARPDGRFWPVPE